MGNLPSFFVVDCWCEAVCHCQGSLLQNGALQTVTWTRGPLLQTGPGRLSNRGRNLQVRIPLLTGRGVGRWLSGCPGLRWGESRYIWGWTLSWRPAPCFGGLCLKKGMTVGLGNWSPQKMGPANLGLLQIGKNHPRSWQQGSPCWRGVTGLGTAAERHQSLSEDMAEGQDRGNGKNK